MIEVYISIGVLVSALYLYWYADDMEPLDATILYFAVIPVWPVVVLVHLWHIIRERWLP